jgi:hypothetical protein
MNIFILDSTGSMTPFEAMERLSDYVPTDRIAIAQPNDAGLWSVRFDDGPTVTTQVIPEGIVPLVMLAADRFDVADPLLVLTDTPDAWATHLERLEFAKVSDDAFLSFPDEGMPCTTMTPTLSALLDISAVVVPSLVRFRSAERFYQCARQAIRKDARLSNEFSLGCVVRELYLSHADISYQTHDEEVICAPTRVSEAALVS